MLQDLKGIIERASVGASTPDDIQALAEAIQSGQIVLVSGQQAVGINGDAEDTNILTGNNNQITKTEYHYGLSVDDIRLVIQELKSLQICAEPASDKSEQMFEEDPLVPIIEPQTVGLINSRMAIIGELQKSGYLSTTQQIEFNHLKRKVYSLKNFDQELELLASNVSHILKEALSVLTKKLRELDHSYGESLLEARSQVCLQGQIELLIQFQSQLGDGKIVAYWLNHKRAQSLAKDLGQYALNYYPEIAETLSSRKLEAFYFSVEQFLERLTHCLVWGRINSLDKPTTPIVLDDKVYIAAFEHLKALLPIHLPNDGINQLNEYIDYLIHNLHTYQHISID